MQQTKIAISIFLGKTIKITGIFNKILVQNSKTPVLEHFIELYTCSNEISDNIVITEEDIELFTKFIQDTDYWENLVDMFIPEIYGLRHIKTAMLLQMLGGCSKTLTNTRLRGDIHILLIGDPGTAKSQLLKNASHLTNGIYVSGSGATSAGLTAAAVKDEFMDGRWSLEAGALVLGDLNYVFIDEIDKVKYTDIVAIHEAMEQQTVSIAKAGLVLTLNSRCGVLAAANPKLGRFDINNSIESQLTLPLPLLSRFDLIFLIHDSFDKLIDSRTSEHILNVHRDNIFTKNNIDTYLFMKKYIKYCRQLRPILTKKSSDLISKKYLQLRHNNKALVVTTRQLQSIIRLAEAKAKSRLADFVSEFDVSFAADLVLSTVIDNANTQIIDRELLETGFSKKQRELCNLVLDIIVKNPKITENTLAQLSKLDISKLRIIVNKLKKSGYIYEPTASCYQKV